MGIGPSTLLTTSTNQTPIFRSNDQQPNHKHEEDEDHHPTINHHRQPKQEQQPEQEQQQQQPKFSNLRSGFLPRTPPMRRLHEEPFNNWESALELARSTFDLIQSTSTKNHNSILKFKHHIEYELITIHDLQSISNSIRSLRRAHLVLTFLMHFYVHSSSTTNNNNKNQHNNLSSSSAHDQNPTQVPSRVPKSIAIPLCAVSRLLDIPPVLTYADTVLYNWALIHPDKGFTPENIEILTTFTNTISEQHFYKTSILIESLGPDCLTLMKSSLDETYILNDLSIITISSSLHLLSLVIDQIRLILESVRDHCQPKEFYWNIRPWLNGGLRLMEGVNNHNHNTLDQTTLITDFGGPSAGQSTLIHSIDVFLGIDHSNDQNNLILKTNDNNNNNNSDHHHLNDYQKTKNSNNSNHIDSKLLTGEQTFMKRMYEYMPKHHRQFLIDLKTSLTNQSSKKIFPTIPDHHQSTYSIRSLSKISSNDSQLRLQYNLIIQSVFNLRSSHFKIACLYIISQSNSNLHQPIVHFLNQEPEHEQEKKEEEEEEKEKKEVIKRLSDLDDDQNVLMVPTIDHQLNDVIHLGTGGTDLSKFLKRCQQSTLQAKIN